MYQSCQIRLGLSNKQPPKSNNLKEWCLFITHISCLLQWRSAVDVGGRLYFAFLFSMSQVDGGFQILAYVIPEGGKKETREPILALKFLSVRDTCHLWYFTGQSNSHSHAWVQCVGICNCPIGRSGDCLWTITHCIPNGAFYLY